MKISQHQGAVEFCHLKKMFTRRYFLKALLAVLLAWEVSGIVCCAEQKVQEGHSLLVVGGANYEALSAFPFLIDPVLRKHLESAGWDVAECRWSELTPEKASRFQVIAFLQTPNLPAGSLEKDPQFQKMERVLSRHMELGGGVLVFADQFRGRIQPVLDAWLRPWNIQVVPLELESASKTAFEAYPALAWVDGAFVPQGSPFASGLSCAVPVGAELTFLLELGTDWKPVLVGPAEARAVVSVASGLQDAGQTREAPLVLAAARDFGKARMVVVGSHSSFWMLNPYHEFWDGGRILKSGGLEFMDAALGWLAEAKGMPLGGDKSQAAVDLRNDRRESPDPQRAAYATASMKGIVGVDPGAEGAMIQEMTAVARELGLDFLVFTPAAADVSSKEDWKRFVQSCSEASRNGFRAIPGVSFDSVETGNKGMAFNLKKPWDEIPWNGDSFETFTRVGVNTDWESLVVLRDPEGSPFPLENLGAVTAIEVGPESADRYREAVEGGWSLIPVAVSAVRTLDDLRSAALGWTTTIYSKNAGAEKFGRWPHLSVGHGRIGEFTLAADNEWEPKDWSAVKVVFRAEALPVGAVVTLRCGSRALATAPVLDGKAEIEWRGVAGGWSAFHIEALGVDGKPVFAASPLAISKTAFSAFIGSDLMNGYWYPVRPAKADEPDAKLLGGRFGLLGTTVYPQLGWGGHFQLRSLNQLSEPLGFEIGSPPGGLPRMIVGYRWREGGSLPELAPKRSIAVNSTQAVVWRDTETLLRRETKPEGKRRLAVEAIPGVKSSLRTTGYRWWDHAALLFEATADIDPASPLIDKESVLATLNLGDPAASFTKLEKWSSGALEVLPARAKVTLSPGEGVSTGDHPMGMVSVWALDTPLTVRLGPAEAKPLLTVSQPSTGDPQRTATFLIVLSNHRQGKVSTVNDVAEAIYQTAQWGSDTAGGASFFQKGSLLAGGESARFDQPGRVWRGALRGLERDVEAMACWIENEALKWQPIPPPDADGISPVLFESAPAGDVFLGHPILVEGGEALVSLNPPGLGKTDWTLRVQNISRAKRELKISTHPALKGILAPWCVREMFAPSEARTWTLKLSRVEE